MTAQPETEAKPLTLNEMRQILRECTTIVKPSETLILRVSGFSPERVEYYQENLDAWLDRHGRPFSALVLEGAGLGIAEAASEP